MARLQAVWARAARYGAPPRRRQPHWTGRRKTDIRRAAALVGSTRGRHCASRANRRMRGSQSVVQNPRSAYVSRSAVVVRPTVSGDQAKWLGACRFGLPALLDRKKTSCVPLGFVGRPRFRNQGQAPRPHSALRRLRFSSRRGSHSLARAVGGARLAVDVVPIRLAHQTDAPAIH